MKNTLVPVERLPEFKRYDRNSLHSIGRQVTLFYLRRDKVSESGALHSGTSMMAVMV